LPILTIQATSIEYPPVGILLKQRLLATIGVALHRLWPRWKEVLVIVKPETVARPSLTSRIVGLPRVGGLHHRYVWAEAA
jgi:hypothetical protein